MVTGSGDDLARQVGSERSSAMNDFDLTVIAYAGWIISMLLALVLGVTRQRSASSPGETA
jgi:hypothetical protein